MDQATKLKLLRHLANADQFIRDKKLKRARNQIAHARETVEAIDIDDPPPPPPPPPPADDLDPSLYRRFSSFEQSLGEGNDGWDTRAPFTITRTSERGAAHGTHAAKIVTNGGNQGCSCPRMKFEDGTKYGVGQKVRFGGSWLITNHALVWSRLMNLGYYREGGSPATELYVFGLFCEQPGRLRMMTKHYDSEAGRSIHADFPFTTNQWFNIDVHATLSPKDGDAMTEVFVNGKLVGASTLKNMMNSNPMHFYMAGLSYFWPGNGNTTVYFDAARIK